MLTHWSYVPLALSHWHDANANLSANGSTAFNCKLCCHWLKGLQQGHMAFEGFRKALERTQLQSFVECLHACIRSYAMKIHHDDVIKHSPHYRPFVLGIHRWPVNSLHKGQWCKALMFSLICVWNNRWVNKGDAGDLRRQSSCSLWRHCNDRYWHIEAWTKWLSFCRQHFFEMHFSCMKIIVFWFDFH